MEIVRFFLKIFACPFADKLLGTVIRNCERLKGIGSGGGISSSGEVAALARLKGDIGEDAVFFDVGANVGHYSAGVLSILQGKRVTFHCFEPSAAAFKTLVANPALRNTAQTRIIFNNVALGAYAGEATLFSDVQSSGLASLSHRRLDHFNIHMGRQESVSVRTLDDYAEEYDVAVIDFLKIDVEGHELGVLAGAKCLLEAKKIRHIQFEFGGCNIDTRTYFQDFWYALTPYGYILHRITPSGWLCPIPAYSEHLERFTTTNFIASLQSLT